MGKLDAQIRRAIAGDVETLSAFAAATFPLGGRPGADPAHLATYIASELTPQRLRVMIDDPNVKVFLAELDNGVAGYAALIRDSRHPLVEAARTAELRKLYVDKRFHGAGIADQLMNAAMSSTQSDCGAVWLSVYSENPRAIAFYKRWGFRVVGTQDFLVGEDAQKDFVMQRDSQKSV